MIGDPFDNRDTNGVTESEESLVERNLEREIVGSHQPGALARGEESHGKFPASRDKQNLSAAPSPGSPQATGDAIGSEFRHGSGGTDTAKNGGIRVLGPGDHRIGRRPVLWTHLIEQIETAFPAPPCHGVGRKLLDDIVQRGSPFG